MVGFLTLACLVAGLVVAGCQETGVAAPADVAVPTQLPASAPAPVDTPPVLPPPCAEFLFQLRCWLRASGNGDVDVRRAVGNARARLEAQPSPSSICESAMVYRHDAIAAAGCSDVRPDLDALPTGEPIPCTEHEYFFVRRDGHVAGCHRDCTTSGDCPRGQSCSSTGSTAGGPIDERFCE